MNYSEMTDFEISVRVGDLKGVRWANLDENYNPLSVWNGDDLCVFNPCNSWADAGPIIEKENISLIFGFGHWDAVSPYGERLQAEEVNPLRAAMIVFLMMQESK